MSININGYELNYSRVSHLLSGNRYEATHMGLWDKFKDLFRTEKKEHAIQTLYNILYQDRAPCQGVESSDGVDIPSNHWYGVISVFEKLKSYAGEAHKDRFHSEFDTDTRTITLSIDNHIIKKIRMDIMLSDIAIDGRYFIADYQNILRSTHSRSSSLGSLKENNESFIFHDFYSRFPKLHNILLSCKMNDFDMMGSIMSDLTQNRLMSSQMALNLMEMQKHLTEKLSCEQPVSAIKGRRPHSL
ncbi:hypothetical protein J5069_10470 [Candidatus Symbiopectobacterium sp. NZEC127]|uniref:hypothetical protein n=1 Tax=Candidatus Symbiopectobacterium sp. NZEC127 TaxID=2820472 RepID=UPI0022270152|nr:hypothetical protein [Candidatus Symbiopectobacterium sp. NZEC127]MCW2486319.1 hypothetical protein [Candidatus Symbiopectobacterium sp. NZEC127]